MTALISLDLLAYLIGLILLSIAAAMLTDRSNPKRLLTALFWGLLAASLLLGPAAIHTWGKPVAYQAMGAAVVLAALIAGLGGVGRGSAQLVVDSDPEHPVGFSIFLPSLTIPMITVFCSLALKSVKIGGVSLFDNQPTLGALAVGAITALLLAFVVTRRGPRTAFTEARRLLDTIGWIAVLPLILAILGGIFTAAKTGDSVKHLALMAAPEHQRFLVVTIYCIGMALFTIIMGNAFAAFPVMTAGIALPVLIKGMGGNPSAIVAMGMYAGYCGTLVTPMAANFNIMPAALLELRDRYGLIKAQWITATIVLFASIVLMSTLAFH